VWGWVGAETQHVVVARAPAPAPEQVLAFAAHYDTKTDLLDHVERAPVDWLGAPLLALLPLGAFALRAAQRGGRGARAARRFAGTLGWAALGYGVLAFAALSAGAFLPRRSPGALDDGAACAVLVRLAERLAAEPLARTEVHIWLFPAEEVGVQGSSAFAAARFSGKPSLPTAVVNLEGLGASADHAVVSRERFLLRSFAPGADLVARLDGVHRERFGRPLGALPFGGATDARSFLARGVPAATLMTLEAGTPFLRDLHSAGDSRERVDPAALDASLDYLLAVARAVDARLLP
jgi:acetylornithine deacetylase/succinyl-diaminopimelate desuccinylase-like protein